TKTIAFHTDGSRTETQYVSGSDYTTIVTDYSASNTVTSIERYDASGVIVYDQDISGTTTTLTVWNADRSKQVSVTQAGTLTSVSSYDAAGTLTTRIVYSSDGSR
ncbi:hypothetical protein, partial [Xanthobacter autotrophicus]|uniref:hypothetical protein n=1 Tax=Xanthobacter autotrophicus TaxID=280 RepID=UPI0037294FE3